MKDNDQGKRQTINTLSNLFKDFNDSEPNNSFRMPTMSFLDENAHNLRNDVLQEEIDENEEFSRIITKKLDDIKKNSISQFQNRIDLMNKNYDKFKDKILDFISVKEKRISDVSNPEGDSKCIFKYVSLNIFKKMNSTIQICNNIIINIEKNFELLNSFFEQNSLINNHRQIENFLMVNSKLIEECSVINKFNFTELDTTNLNKIDYYQFYIKYLSQKKIEEEGIAKNYKIQKNDLQNGIRFIMENFAGLEKLKLEGINNNEFLSILENIGININKNKKYNLSKLDIKNFGSIDSKIDKNLLLNQIGKLKIQRGVFITMSTITKLFIDNNPKLTKISLEYINMTDIGFKTLLLSLIKNPNITITLKYLSLEGNRITMVKYDNENGKKQNTFFQNLEVLNLSKNGIYKFEFFLTALPNLKFLDLTSNNIPTGSFMESAIKLKDKLVLLNDNMFITNSQNNNNIYINYLNERLPKFDTYINTLNLNFTYDIEKQKHLENMKISLNVSITLIKLDLSFCGLYTDVLVKFFTTNPKFLSLRFLYLRYNNITGDFFEKIMSNENICLDNINFIDLSENEIVCETNEKIQNLGKFIEKHNNLENMQLINTGFFTDLIGKMKDNNPNSEKFKTVFLDLKKYLEDNQREFKFIINEGNATFIKQEFHPFFNFKFSKG